MTSTVTFKLVVLWIDRHKYSTKLNDELTNPLHWLFCSHESLCPEKHSTKISQLTLKYFYYSIIFTIHSSRCHEEIHYCIRIDYYTRKICNLNDIQQCEPSIQLLKLCVKVHAVCHLTAQSIVVLYPYPSSHRNVINMDPVLFLNLV